MNYKLYKKEISLPDGRIITIETGKLAKQADGSAVIQMGNAMLLATVVSSKTKSPVDFLPLTVDYREKFAAAGKFPGGFFKREARPSTEEILTMRLVDRVLRPLFPKNYHYETQVMIQLMSHDENVMPDSLAGLAASTVIQLSDIPFEYPISEVRVARIDNEFVINPSRSQLEESDIDIMVGASYDSVSMVEGEFDEISEEDMTNAIKFGHDAIKNQIEAQNELVNEIGKKDTRDYDSGLEDDDLLKIIHDKCYSDCYEIAKKGLSKKDRSQEFSIIKEKLYDSFSEEEIEEKGALIKSYFSKVEKDAVRELVLSEGVRLDGRKTDDIRPIWCEVNYLPSTHGSSIFTRGETQALATVTLGTSRDANIIDSPTNQGEENFYLHYNFPPFSTGEARPLRGTSRREIGHGNLAQRALKKVFPSDCPYTVRVVAEVLESNGSSSMATVCSGTMAMMDAGVKISKPVSGIAMGLISDKEDKSRYAILSDILGDEDHLGDMDFKVTGTRDGITACQMDIKIEGLSYEILEKALNQAKNGRLHILDKIEECIKEPRTNLKPQTPKIITLTVPKSTIGAIIGPGGKVIQEMQQKTETSISIEEVDEKGIVEILGTDQEKIDFAISEIKSIAFVPELNKVYKGIVKNITTFGAFVGISKNTDGLLHISEIAWERVEKVEDHLKEGQEIEVKLINIDEKSGKLKLSRKVLIEKKETKKD